MDLSESYNKNKHLVDDDNEHLLNEVSVASSVGGFTGQGGQLVDRLFGGAFHPEFGQIKDLLGKQIDANIVRRMWTDDNTPLPERDYIDLKYKYDFDEIQNIDNSKFKSTSETEMQQVELNIDYEKLDTEKTKLQIHLNLDDEKDEWKSNVKYVYDDDTLFKIKKLKFKNTSKKDMQVIPMEDWKDEFNDYLKNKDNSKFKNTSEDQMQYVDIEIPYDKVVKKSEHKDVVKKFVSDENRWEYIYQLKKQK